MKKGFTLIEVLITVTILAILAMIGLATYAQSQRTARDGKRKADLQAIRSALEMYKADQGNYPATGDYPSELIDERYIKSMPLDPSHPKLEYGYTLDESNYCLGAILETGGAGTCCLSATCSDEGANCTYCVENP